MQATAWILDLTHRARRLECDVATGQRALAAMQEVVQRELSLTLGIPIGLRALESSPEFLFLLPRQGAGPGWMPLGEWVRDDRAYSLYAEAMLGGWQPPSRDFDVTRFGNNPELSAKLADLVVKGNKRGTTGWVAAAERDGSGLPEVGRISVVTDGFGYARCAIRSEQVEYRRFADIDAAQAWAEGEGDRTLEDWRHGHLRYFHVEAKALGLTFSEDEIVFFEHFRVLALFGRADGAK